MLNDRIRRDDRGFTLIEVVVAFVLIAIMSTAALAFSIRANTTSSYIQHREVAVTVAGQSMDLIASTSAYGGGLVVGRCQTQVTSDFSANSSVNGVSATYPKWGTTDCTATPAVPDPPAPTTLAGTIYTTTILIGTCYRPRLAVNGTDCAKVTGYASDLTSAQAASADVIDEYRAIVIVRWNADDECPSGCVYQTSTLVDPNSDLTWVNS